MTGITDYDLDDERVGMAYEIACYEIRYLDSFSDDPDYDPAAYAVEILKRFEDPEFVRMLTDDFEREALWNHSDPGQNLKARNIYAFLRDLQRDFAAKGEVRAVVPGHRLRRGSPNSLRRAKKREMGRR